MKDYTKILSQKANREELEDLFEELESDSSIKDDFVEQQTLWNLLAIAGQRASKEQKQQSFNQFWKQTRNTKSIRIFNLTKYAAVFLAAIGLTFLVQYASGLFSSEPNYTYQTQKGGVTEFTLADGTSIWLNSDSKLEVFEANNEVTVNLSGEAFFDVTHNPSRSFIVNAGGLKIEDLGTQFNVSAYETASLIKTTLLEGDIDLFDHNNKPLKKIETGQVALYHKKRQKMWVKTADIDADIAWKDGKFAFIDKSLATICKELERWYEVDISISDSELAKTKYSCMLKRPTTVSQVLDIIQKTSNIHYKIHTTKDGKEEVIITSKSYK